MKQVIFLFITINKRSLFLSSSHGLLFSGNVSWICEIIYTTAYLIYYRGGYKTATRFNIPHFNDSFSWYYQPNNYITNSSLLIIKMLNSSILDHISHIHSDAFKKQTKPKKTSNF